MGGGVKLKIWGGRGGVKIGLCVTTTCTTAGTVCREELISQL